jgi:hypothetical protein
MSYIYLHAEESNKLNTSSNIIILIQQGERDFWEMCHARKETFYKLSVVEPEEKETLENFDVEGRYYHENVFLINKIIEPGL